MGRSAEIARRRLEAQGFVGLTDREVAEFDLWLRFTPAVFLAWTATGVYFGSPSILGALIPFALAGGLWERHPFDLIYNYGLRKISGAQRLPRYGWPRRLASMIAALMITATAISFYFHYFAVGYMLGFPMITMAAVNVIRGSCISSLIYNAAIPVKRAQKHGEELGISKKKKIRILNPISETARKH